MVSVTAVGILVNLRADSRKGQSHLSHHRNLHPVPLLEETPDGTDLRKQPEGRAYDPVDRTGLVLDTNRESYEAASPRPVEMEV